MTRDYSRLLHSLWRDHGRCERSEWCPPADVHRDAQGWLIKLELAAVRLEDVQLRAVDCSVTIEGTRRDWSIREGQQCYSMEIAYNRFERTFELPCRIEGARIEMEYRDGMLLIRLQTGDDECP
jgi:HSP20 family protein